jgi:hypothetical protein
MTHLAGALMPIAIIAEKLLDFPLDKWSDEIATVLAGRP